MKRPRTSPELSPAQREIMEVLGSGAVWPPAKCETFSRRGGTSPGIRSARCWSGWKAKGGSRTARLAARSCTHPRN